MPEGVARAGLARLSEPPGHPAFESLEPMGNNADQGGGATEAGAEPQQGDGSVVGNTVCRELFLHQQG